MNKREREKALLRSLISSVFIFEKRLDKIMEFPLKPGWGKELSKAVNRLTLANQGAMYSKDGLDMLLEKVTENYEKKFEDIEDKIRE